MVTDRRIENRWDPARAAGLDDLSLLVYASNLLGSDPRITNFGGGNTSVKTTVPHPLTGEPTRVLWVKGSGGDLGTATAAGFASLELERILDLERVARDRGLPEDEVVPLYAHCTFGLNTTPCSIDTPLHAFVPAAAVSHMHSDAVIAIAASAEAEALTREVWGGRLGYLPWKRPGFDLGLALRDLIAADPAIEGALMASHGFICWADDWEACYARTLDLIDQAQTFIDARSGGLSVFGPPVRQAEPTLTRADTARFLTRLRGAVSHEGQRQIAHLDSSAEALAFIAAERAPQLADLGTSCPDHFLRTKFRPLFLPAPADADVDRALADFRAEYAAYYGRCRRPDSPPMRNPNPSVVLVPEVGIVSFGRSPQEARVTGMFYRNAIRVMEGAETVSSYTALPEQEAFDIEYWQLEEAKLRRMPPERELSRQVAVVTGAASGIGRATAGRLLELGACVLALDIDAGRLASTVDEFAVRHPGGVINGEVCDVTDAAALGRAFETAALTFGGVDIVVVNAGDARRGTVDATSEDDYQRLSDLLMRAYFDTIALAVRTMRVQGTGGSIVVVGSKNGVGVGSQAALYSAAKAFELHLARAVAVDHARDGIRCNVVNPDAVVVGSGIWSEAWRAQTAASLGIAPDEIEEHYRRRSLLGVTVRPEDVAEAIVWLAGPRASRTTGGVITVDGGNREGFVR